MNWIPKTPDFTRDYFQTQNALVDFFMPRLSAGAILLYIVLRRHSYRKKPRPVSALCREMGCGRTKIFELLSELENHCMIRRIPTVANLNCIETLDLEEARKYVLQFGANARNDCYVREVAQLNMSDYS